MTRKVRTPTQGEVLLAVAAYTRSSERLLAKISRLEASGNLDHPLSAAYDRIHEAKTQAVQASQCC